MSADERLENYLDRVCMHVRWRPYRNRVRAELTDHVLTRAAYLHEKRGFPEQAAIAQAILQLGSPEELGHKLSQAHRPYRHLLFWTVTTAVWIAILACAIVLIRQFY